jgi:hypothetical protein
MEGSVLSFLKSAWKVSNTGPAHWASSFFWICLKNSYLEFGNRFVVVFTVPEIWEYQKSYINGLKTNIGPYGK